MQIFAQPFWMQKAGNAPEEYEDAFWPNKEVDVSAHDFRFAVADGATETSFSGAWAKMLVRAYCKGNINEKRWTNGLPPLQKKWLASVERNDLPWYAEAKIADGAFSSLLGLILSHDRMSNSRIWKSFAIGDSCLFHLRGDALLASFPFSRSTQFNSRPNLISSNEVNNTRLLDNVRCASGYFADGDAFYLMTDAIACWFLKSTEDGTEPWRKIRDVDTGEGNEFSAFVADLRARGEIRNDDVTLFRIEIA